MVEVNPFSLLGRGIPDNVPNKALQELQVKGALQDVNNQALGRRQDSANESGEFRTGITAGLNTRGSNFLKNLETGRVSSVLNKNADTFGTVQRGGGRFVLPKGGLDLSNAVQQPIVSGQFPGAAAEQVKLQAQFKDENKQEKMVVDGEGYLVKQTSTTSTQVTGKAADERIPKMLDMLKRARKELGPEADRVRINKQGKVTVEYKGTTYVLAPI